MKGINAANKLLNELKEDNPDKYWEMKKTMGKKLSPIIKKAYEDDPTYIIRVKKGYKKWRDSLTDEERAIKKQKAIDALEIAHKKVAWMKENDPEAYEHLLKVKIGRKVSATKKKKFLENPNAPEFNIIKGDTSIELAVQKELRERNIPFKSNCFLHLKDGKEKVVLCPDLYLKEHRIVVECDGSYWHSTPYQIERDKYKDRIYKENGYTVIRLPEVDIKKDVSESADRIERLTMNHFGRYKSAIMNIDVIKVERETFKKNSHKVVDLMVEEDETFIVRGAVLHNCRLAFPCSSQIARYVTNYPEVVWKVAHGEDVEVEKRDDYEYSAEITLATENEKTWRTIRFPKEMKDNVGFRRVVNKDGDYWLVPGDSVAAVALAQGDT